jgi:pimeloyl-ACP methyl ester carboxylesterase
MIFSALAFVAAIPALIALLLLCGFLYQSIGGLLDRRRLLAPGRLIDTGHGRRLYLVEKGQGGPSVVFESGFGATSLNWTEIQDALAEHVHTVAYDRCGLGWSSEPVSERIPSHIAAELRSLLHAAGVQPPYVLVGHSFGGLVMQRFALDYPGEVAGVVLVDPMRTHEWPPVNPDRHATVARAQRFASHGVHVARFGLARLAARSHLCCSAKFSGFLIRLAGPNGTFLADRLNTEIGKMPSHIRPAIAAHWSDPRFYRGFIAHLNSVAATVREMHDPEPIPDIPVTVLTPATATPVTDEDMRRFGRHSRQVIARRSQHWIHLDEPDLVIDTILQMVSRVASPDQEAATSLALPCGAD